MERILIKRKNGSPIFLKRSAFIFSKLSRKSKKVLNCRGSSVLVSTDVAAMGLDVKDLNLSINIPEIYVYFSDSRLRNNTFIAAFSQEGQNPFIH